MSWLGRLCGITLRATVFDPLAQQFLFGRGHAAVVGKRTVLWIGVPGRHPLLVEHFGNHFTPTGRLLVGCQIERTNLACPVAFDASRLQDWRDVARVRD